MESLRVSKMPGILSTSVGCHHPQTGSTLVLNCSKNLKSSTNFFGGWARHIACLKNTRSAYIIWFGKRFGELGMDGMILKHILER
jgi:hypothetical protein